MASEGTHAVVAPRDGDSTGNGNLTTGAIAGIACGAGALFLGAAGLFLVYWRRQRQFDREDDERDRFDESRLPGAMPPVVTYTMDYKMDDPQYHEGDQGSSYTYSPEKASYAFPPLGAADAAASAMPTHPAYIPRALVRGAATPSNRSTATTSPAPFPSPPLGSSSTNPKNKADDTVFLAYLQAAQQQASSHPQDTILRAGEPGPPPEGGLPNHPRPLNPPPTHVPAMAVPSFTTSPPHSASSTDGAKTNPPPHHQRQPSQSQSAASGQRKPRAFLPPRLKLPFNSSTTTANPLPGKENTTISGPLAFPQHYQGPSPPGHGRSGWVRETDDDADGEDGGGTSDNRRWSFRGRVLTGEREKKKGRRKSDRNSNGGAGGGGNRHYAEIEVGRGSDIW
ncbi:hypothetical protein VTI74DRAFT_1457 [Chaetomium olivicolor]